jgi:hypothetical protein
MQFTSPHIHTPEIAASHYLCHVMELQTITQVRLVTPIPLHCLSVCHAPEWRVYFHTCHLSHGARSSHALSIKSQTLKVQLIRQLCCTDCTINVLQISWCHINGLGLNEPCMEQSQQATIDESAQLHESITSVKADQEAY